MVVAVWVVLLHSSTGQQPPVPAPPAPLRPDCSNCSSICTPSCKERVAACHARTCRGFAPHTYSWCLEDCANSTCNSARPPLLFKNYRWRPCLLQHGYRLHAPALRQTLSPGLLQILHCPKLTLGTTTACWCTTWGAAAWATAWMAACTTASRSTSVTDRSIDLTNGSDPIHRCARYVTHYVVYFLLELKFGD